MVGGSAAVDSSSDTGSGNVDRGLAKDRDSSPRVKKVETGRHAETRSPNAELESKKKGGLWLNRRWSRSPSALGIRRTIFLSTSA